jgi:SAM-dependent methyltransferase
MKTELPPDLSIRIKIIKELGYDLNDQTMILDFGCGSGKKVKELRNLGYFAFGCGTRFNKEEGIDTELLLQQGILRKINLEHYALPFEDNAFDFIFSESVFEHVKNYPESISEISRVLKPDGICLHTFVPRYKPIEAHVMVPFASFIQSYWWLYLWVLLGIKNEWQDCHSVRERAARFYNYLKNETNYLTKRQLLSQFKLKFSKVIFCEDLFLKFSSGKRKYLYSLSRLLPFIPNLFSALQMRVILTGMPAK